MNKKKLIFLLVLGISALYFVNYGVPNFTLMTPATNALIIIGVVVGILFLAKKRKRRKHR